MDHLDKARRFAHQASEHSAVPELSRTATQRGIMHALIDIAESLRAQRPLVPDPTVRDFGDRRVRVVNLADLPLEHVVGVDDE